MSQTARRTIVFADLRGSTGLFESLGNVVAARQVTMLVATLSAVVSQQGGRVVKTLGDGLMAVFDHPEPALAAADTMHAALGRLALRQPGLRRLALQIAMSHGEVVELAGDCLGDGVNVAARLLERAGDDETLATAELVEQLEPDSRERFRALPRMQLRGRQEPVAVLRLAAERFGDTAITAAFEPSQPAPLPGLRLRLSTGRSALDLGPADLPITLGRSNEATLPLASTRVSRTHARIEWLGGAFELVDLSANGSFVRFTPPGSPPGEMLALRRGHCTLHGSGILTLGGPPGAAGTAAVAFVVQRDGD